MTIVHRFKLKYDISNYNGIYYRHVVLPIPPSRILPQLRMMMMVVVVVVVVVVVMMMMMMMPGNK